MVFRIELPCLYTTDEADEQEQLESSLGIKFGARAKPEIRTVVFYNIDAVTVNKNKDTIQDMGTEDISTLWTGTGYFVCALSQEEVDRRIMEIKVNCQPY